MLGQALKLSARSAVAFARMSPAVPDGRAVLLDVAQLQALPAKTFNVGRRGASISRAAVVIFHARVELAVGHGGRRACMPGDAHRP